jgi:hypothetical protein
MARMRLELEPPHGVDLLRLGMTADEARAALKQLGDVEPDRQDGLYAHRPGGLGLTAHLGADARVNAIEVWRPQADDTVHYQDVDVFGLPALEVVARLGRLATVHPDADDPSSHVAPDLLLSFWRPFAGDDDPDDPQGYYFSSVLVARPGYYDTPDDADGA